MNSVTKDLVEDCDQELRDHIEALRVQRALPATKARILFAARLEWAIQELRLELEHMDPEERWYTK